MASEDDVTRNDHGKTYKPRSGKDGRGPRRDRDDHGKGDFRKGRRDDSRNGDRRGGPRQGHGDRRPRDDRRDGRRDDRRGGRPAGNGPRNNRPSNNGPRDGGRRHDGQRRDGRRDDRRDGRGYGDRRPRDQERPRERPSEPAKQQEPQELNLTVPSTPQRILFKGVDCEVNGRKDLAMVLYLHGATRMSKGCENNMLRMLREAGPEQFPTIRGRVAKACPEDAMVAFDYLCLTIDPRWERTALDAAAAQGIPLAIYERIRLGEIEGDDPCIDVFARCPDEAMAVDGLKILVRKKDSVRAEELLKDIEERKRLRQSIRTEFIRATKGERHAVRRLEELSDEFPEAAFLRGYLDTDDREEYLRNGMEAHRDLITSLVHELGISDTPFGKYLSAMKLRSDGDEWIPPMIAAAVSGSDDAVEELMPAQARKDVRKGLSKVYLNRGDAAGLVRYYDGEDTSDLDRYCIGNPERMIEVGRIMGGYREINWLKKCCLEGYEDCGRALSSLSKDEARRSKQLIYALHDVGRDMDAAKLYFQMYGDPSLPSVKWLSKVCENESVKEYVRTRFEEMGDLATFDYIFVDDGYNSGGDRRGGKGSHRGTGNSRRGSR